MSAVLQALDRHARERPRAPALIGEARTLDYAALAAEVERVAAWLSAAGVRCLALLLDNGPAWAVLDLAAQRAGVALLPLPAFFTRAQQRHAMADAGADRLLAASPDDLAALGAGAGAVAAIAGSPCRWADLEPARPGRLPPGTAKVTYTSGTTGTPKGVCLTQHAIDRVALSLLEAAAAGPEDRHLALLPLALLLENIAGIDVPLLAGGACLLPPQASVGMLGSSRVDPVRMVRTLGESGATSAITVPALLRALVAALAGGVPRPPRLRFLAVGGGTVSAQLLARAHTLGLPVFQGYGLSECASVVAVNRPGSDAPGSVGRPLPHVRLAFAADGEIRVHAPGFLGYLGRAQPACDWFDTGDRGHLDAAGNLVLDGRKKNIFITAFGRNVDPEWVEAELTAEPALAQAAVFGEARPWNVAVVASAADALEVGAAIAAANRRLPDYARVRSWLRAAEPFSPANGQATANGRLRRAAIATSYGDAIDSLYESQEVS